MAEDQRIARIFGVLFLITFVTSIGAVALFQSVLDDPAGYIAGGGQGQPDLPGRVPGALPHHLERRDGRVAAESTKTRVNSSSTELKLRGIRLALRREHSGPSRRVALDPW